MRMVDPAHGGGSEESKFPSCPGSITSPRSVGDNLHSTMKQCPGFCSALQAAPARDLQSLSHANQRFHESGCPSVSARSKPVEDCPRQRRNWSKHFLPFFRSTIVQVSSYS